MSLRNFKLTHYKYAQNRLQYIFISDASSPLLMMKLNKKRNLKLKKKKIFYTICYRNILISYCSFNFI